MKTGYPQWMIDGGLCFLFLLALIDIVCAVPPYSTLTIYMNSSICKDTWISSHSPTVSFGNTTEMYIGHYSTNRWYRGLVECTLPSMYSGAINEVNISLYCYYSEGYSTINNRTIEAHGLGADDSHGFTNNATWNRYDGLNNWSLPGVNYNSTIIDSNFINRINCDTDPQWMTWNLQGPNAENPLPLSFGGTFRVLFKYDAEDGASYVNDRFRAIENATYSGRIVIYYLKDGVTVQDISVNSSNVAVNESLTYSAAATTSAGTMGSVYFNVKTPYGTLNLSYSSNNGSTYYLICNRTNPCMTNMTGAYNLTSVWANNSLGNVSSSIDGAYSEVRYNFLANPVTETLYLNSQYSDEVEYNITTTVPLNITLSYSNYTNTFMKANETTWANLLGTRSLKMNFSRNAQENKSVKFFVTFNCTTPYCNDQTVYVKTRIKTYPHLLFTNITDVYGYQHMNESPWSTYWSGIRGAAAYALNVNFSSENIGGYNRILYRSEYAHSAALAYQITRNLTYCEKAKQALLNLELGNVSYYADRSDAVYRYSLTYDWSQDCISTEEDEVIRDKLADMADQVYHNINEGGTSDYVTFADYHGKAYPAMGVVGAELSDYTNPNDQDLDSGPDDWLRVGTHDLFVEDSMHDYPGRSLHSFGFDTVTGKHMIGSYKGYVLEEYLWWINVYSRFFNSNIFNDYPVVKLAMTSELWESLPNYHLNNYVTQGNTKWTYHKSILSLLPDDEKGYFLRYLEEAEASDALPYAATYGASDELYFLTYNNYSSIQRSSPSWTTKLTENGLYHIFREGWDTDGDWLSYVTMNTRTYSNRDGAHHDQMSFEYYDKGDLLLADAGEDKHTEDMYYGAYVVYHNTVAFEDPRTPFSVFLPSNSPIGGIFKGYSGGILTPVSFSSINQGDWMEWIDTKATIEYVVTNPSVASSLTLSSPIQYGRSILYPGKDYFIVVDRFESNDSWIYRNLYRPTSFRITPSNWTWVGHVNGNLTIGSSLFDWESLAYKQETETGEYTNSIRWQTVNPYNDTVHMRIFSAPASDVLVTKHVGRIAGYDVYSEVYNPVVYLRRPENKTLYSVAVILTRYNNESEKTAEELTVTGSGSAVKITASDYTDYIYSGNGSSSFSTHATDADTVFLRINSTPTDYTLLNGSYINASGSKLINSSEGLDYLTAKKETGNLTLKLKASDAGEVTIHQLWMTVEEVRVDGDVYNDWVQDDEDSITITVERGEHSFEIYGEGSVPPTTTTTTTTTSTTTTTLPGPCELVGDYEPCDDVTLSEVVALIQRWVGNEVSLSSVVNLIQGWVNS